jgi:hypothetical protein
MRLWPKSLKWRAILLTLLVTASSCGVTCLLNPSMVDDWVFPARKWVEHQVERQKEIDRLKESEHASLRDLAHGEFGRGSSADEWFAKHPPTQCFRHDNYITAHYLRDEFGIFLVVISRDSELIHAHIGYTYYDFFTFRTKAEEKDYADSFERWHKGYCATMPAVLGVAAVSKRIHMSQFPQPVDD